MTTVSPSPRELIALLSNEEKVAIDLILQYEATIEDERLAVLVPDKSRRGYLRTVATQLKALGITVHESSALDRATEGWVAARQRYDERAAAVRQQIAREEEARQLLAKTQPPEVRKSVSRKQRRQQRRKRL
jgi:hypothetical protein